MRPILAIAKNTFREAIRDRIFHALVAFAVLMVASGLVLHYVTIGDVKRIVLNVGLASIHLLGAIIAITVGSSMVYKELAKRTVYTLLSKPVSRTQFLVGKYVGLVAVLWVQLGVLTVVFHALFWLVGGWANASTFAALGLLGVELAVLAAAVLFFASFSGPFTSGFLALLFFLIGHSIAAVAALMAGADQDFAARLEENFAYRAWQTVVAVFPDLERFNLKEEALYQIAVTPGHFLGAVAYGALLAAFFVVAAALVFGRRDFN